MRPVLLEAIGKQFALMHEGIISCGPSMDGAGTKTRVGLES
jgi:hypothetical protein